MASCYIIAREDFMKEKFILFLNSLEVHNPEDFINERPEIIAEVGVRIARAAKCGYNQDKVYYCQKCGNHFGND